MVVPVIDTSNICLFKRRRNPAAYLHENKGDGLHKTTLSFRIFHTYFHFSPPTYLPVVDPLIIYGTFLSCVRSIINLGDIPREVLYLYNKKCINIKVKLSLRLTKHHAMKTYWGSGSIAPRILDPGPREVLHIYNKIMHADTSGGNIT
jgi:hypothetical protein